jgi:hypothetical protein
MTIGRRLGQAVCGEYPRCPRLNFDYYRLPEVFGELRAEDARQCIDLTGSGHDEMNGLGRKLGGLGGCVGRKKHRCRHQSRCKPAIRSTIHIASSATMLTLHITQRNDAPLIVR